jgi:hypothetical protein
VGGIVCIASSNAGTTSQDLKTGYLIGATPKLQQISILIGALASALILGPILLRLNQAATVYVPRVTYEALKDKAATLEANRVADLPIYVSDSQPAGAGPLRQFRCDPDTVLPANAKLDPGDYLVDAQGKVIWKVKRNFMEALRGPTEGLTKQESLIGSQAAQDTKQYWVWQKTDSTNGPPGKYLVDEKGVPAYLVDPGINGTHKIRPDGSAVIKFDAPKATLMSYIIKGILSRKLPWGLVMLGVMISIVLEMASIPSLAFAVGVYLPLSSSSPIFIGGMIRWLVDRYLAHKHRNANLTTEQLVAEGDKSPGVLLASGYIAGGAIAGIAIAFMAGVLENTTQRLTDWSEAFNPFFNGPYSDALSLIPFAILVVVLYLTGREFLFQRKKSAGQSS